MTPGPIQLRLLGPVEIETAGASLAGTKQRLALALLAIRAEQVVPTDLLIDLLWSDGRSADPQRALQVHLSNLRGVLDEAELEATIEHQGRGYVLRIPRGTIDLHRFQDLVQAGVAKLEEDPDGARNDLTEALELWRGRPMGGLDDHPVLRTEIAHLESLRLRALEARIDADLATGNHHGVTGELQRLTDESPLRERMWGQLMIALYRSGRQAEALEAYERARRTLAEELGADPSPQLRQLHDRILQQDPGLEFGSDAPAAGSTIAEEAESARSVAVLPFDVLGGTEDAELLALGLHNDLLTELSRDPGLKVISRTSVLGYQGTTEPIPMIARELGVGTILEGTVQSAGRRLRLTVQLIDATRDAHRWADNYDRELTTENLFAIQTELAHQIASSLSAELLPSGRVTASAGPPTESLEAYRLAAKARQQFDVKTEDAFLRATELYREAIELDPAYVDAWVGLADALASTEAYGHGDRHELLPRAERAVHRALALDPDSAAARTSLGVLRMTYQDGPASLRELDRAIELQPSYADAYTWHTWVSLLVGRKEQAFDSALRSVELDPLSVEPPAHLALAHAAMGDPEEGLDAVRRARALSPYTTASLYEGICLCELGRYEEARDVLEPLTVGATGELRVPWAGHGPDVTYALALSRLGEADAAGAVLDDIDPERFPFATGLVQLGMGEVDRAAESFGRVERLTAWPCLALHHYHADVWHGIADTDPYRDLVRTAYRSWGIDPEP